MPIITANPGTGASLSGLDTAWSDAGNILTENDVRATAGPIGSGGWTNPLKADNFDFSKIPDSAQIVAVQVRVEWHVTGLDLGFDDVVSLMDSDNWTTGRIGDDQAFARIDDEMLESRTYATHDVDALVQLDKAHVNCRWPAIAVDGYGVLARRASPGFLDLVAP